MNDIPDYVDGRGQVHWVVVLKFDLYGYYHNGFVMEQLTRKTYWISRRSLMFLPSVALNEWAVIDFVKGNDYFQCHACAVVPIAHMGQKMSAWIPCIYPDLGWIIVEYAFDLEHVPKDALNAR